MSKESLELEPASPLTDRERGILRIWRGTEQPALAPSLNAKLFGLFLNGKTCDEIMRLNPALSLGQILQARVTGDWDRRRNEHLDRLLNETALRVQQTSLETADFVCDLLAVANRQHGDRLRRYLQTGDERELGDFRIDSISNLKTAIETLQKLTGVDRQQTVRHQGEVVHRAAAEPNLPSPTDAGIALRLLLGKKHE